MIPVADPDAVDQLEQILQLNLADDTQSWGLGSDGRWSRIPSVVGMSAQVALQVAALQRGSLLDEAR